MNNEKKEQLALTVGFFLIIVVIVSTLLRSDLLSSGKTTSSSFDDTQAKQSNAYPYPTISAKELQKRILLSRSGEKLTLLDVRPFDSYIQDHILDAINVTLEEFPISSKIDVHTKVVVISSGSDDKNITDITAKLKEEHIENFVVLVGGMNAWEQSNGTTISYGDPKSFVDQSKVSYVDPEKLDEAMNEKQPVYIVDVRSNSDYNNGHIAGAVNIPFDDLEKRRGDIKENRLVVVGANELQEFQASVQIHDMLLASTFVMRGGMPKWQEKGFKVAN